MRAYARWSGKQFSGHAEDEVPHYPVIDAYFGHGVDVGYPEHMVVDRLNGQRLIVSWEQVSEGGTASPEEKGWKEWLYGIVEACCEHFKPLASGGIWAVVKVDRNGDAVAEDFFEFESTKATPGKWTYDDDPQTQLLFRKSVDNLLEELSAKKCLIFPEKDVKDVVVEINIRGWHK